MSFADDLDQQRQQITRAVRQAGNEWGQAMRAHVLAPPDAGFAQRLRNLAEAAAREQAAWEEAHAAGLALTRPWPQQARPAQQPQPRRARSRTPRSRTRRPDGGAHPLSAAHRRVRSRM